MPVMAHQPDVQRWRVSLRRRSQTHKLDSAPALTTPRIRSSIPEGRADRVFIALLTPALDVGHALRVGDDAAAVAFLADDEASRLHLAALGSRWGEAVIHREATALGKQPPFGSRGVEAGGDTHRARHGRGACEKVEPIRRGDDADVFVAGHGPRAP